MKYLTDEEMKSESQVKTTYLIVRIYLLTFLCLKMAIFVFEVIFFVYNFKKAKRNNQVFEQIINNALQSG